MKKKIIIFLILIFSLQLLIHIYNFKDNYLTKFDPQYWSGRYLRSQWVVPDTKESIGDDGLYAYSGWEYIHGRDPSLLNAEMPPFGKYLIGLTEIIFSNQNVFGLFSGIFALIAFFFLNKIIFKSNLFALIPVVLLSFDSLFYSQLKAPYLDTLYLGLLIMTFIFILKEKYILSNIFLGLSMATKSSFSTFILITIVIVIYLLILRYLSSLKKFLLYMPVAITIFLLTYIRYFFLGHNLIDFLKLQKWTLAFYGSGAKGDPSAVWQILIIGKWPNWFGPVQSVSEYTILWPLASIAFLYYLYYIYKHHPKTKSVLIAVWVIIYLLFLCFIPVWPRYLLLILPFNYTLAIWIIFKNSMNLAKIK